MIIIPVLRDELSVIPAACYLHNIVHIAAVLANQEQATTSAGVLEIIIIKSVHKAVTPEEGRPLACTPPERNKHYSDKTAPVVFWVKTSIIT